jgi:hypothetical protein
MEEALVAYLLANAGLAGLVGTRVYWVERPQAEQLPALTLTKISAPRAYTMKGSAGLVAARVQVDCWAETFGTAKLVARSLVAAIGGRRFDAGGVSFRGVFVEDENDTSEPRPGGGRMSRTRLDLLLWHSEGS